MGIAPRRLWGWEPEQRLERDEAGWRIVTEPEFDKEQYELLVGLYEYEASTDDYGFPLEESMSIESDPLNPNGKRRYEARPIRSWSEQAVVDAAKDPRYSGENHSAARKWRVFEVPR